MSASDPSGCRVYKTSSCTVNFAVKIMSQASGKHKILKNNIAFTHIQDAGFSSFNRGKKKPGLRFENGLAQVAATDPAPAPTSGRRGRAGGQTETFIVSRLAMSRWSSFRKPPWVC